MPSTKFVLYQTAEGEFQFQLQDSNKDVVLQGEASKVKQSSISAIVSCKLHGVSDRNFRKRKSKEGYYFTLRSKPLQILAISPFYTSPAQREKTLNVIKASIQNAELEDLS